ncbi:MAG: Rho termination factor [Bacteroidetes bacterium]|jgi:general stress protein YciG|nr:Rho termination factor [Bacteroidota bacterium]
MTSIKNEKQYEALREQGYSKSAATRIANSPKAGEKGGEAVPYEERSKPELYDLAKKLDIEGRSEMDKKTLIKALRDR